MTDFHASPSLRKAFAGTLVAAPMLWLAAELVSPSLEAKQSAQLTVVAAHPDRWYWYSVLLVAGCIAFVPATVAIGRLARGIGSRVGAVGAMMLAFGAIVGAADAMTQLLMWAAVKGGAEHSLAAVLERYDDSAAANIFFIPGGLAWLLGALVVTISLLRTGSPSRIAALMLGAGAIVNLVGFSANSVPMLGLSAALMLIAGVLFARIILGSADASIASSERSPALV